MKLDRVEKLFSDLFPIQRSLLGVEVDQSIKLLETNFNFEISEFPSGSQIFDWVVPNAWTLNSMTLKTKSGDVIWSHKHSSFSTVFHSNSIHATFTRAELEKHLFTVAGIPSATPYRTSYYGSDFGICMPQKLASTLEDIEYELEIDSEFYPSHLKVCEYVIKGRSEREILFCSYICHPSMANNELSGPVTITSLIEELSNNYSGYHTLRFCLFPETIGALAFLKLRGEHLKRNLVAGYVLTCVGDNAPLAYKKSFSKHDNVNDLTIEVLLQYNQQTPKIYEFEPFGSDERQFNSPGFRLPVGTLCRSKFGEYPEYHTDFDNLSLVRAESIIDNVRFCLELIRSHNHNLRYSRIITEGELFLTKYELYDTIGASTSQSERSKYLAWFLHFSDGTITLYDLCKKADLDFYKMFSVAELCVAKGIVKIV